MREAGHLTNGPGFDRGERLGGEERYEPGFVLAFRHRIEVEHTSQSLSFGPCHVVNRKQESCQRIERGGPTRMHGPVWDTHTGALQGTWWGA